MLMAANLLQEQRSVGRIDLSVAHAGLRNMRESGAAKVRYLKAEGQAILINTGGGLAGGDDFAFAIAAEAGSGLTVTGQAAERVYRTLGPPARVHTSLSVADAAALFWLPQETILFDRSALCRRLDVDLAASARFLAIEPVIFGRREMGEVATHVDLHDRWRIRRSGRLIFGDDIRLSGALPRSMATLDGGSAMLTLLYVAPDAERHVEAVRQAIGPAGGVSAWDGKLVARLVAESGFELRKAVIPALHVLAGPNGLPKIWTA
jgi:urease accessory protein